jgi:hypothetical protein
MSHRGAGAAPMAMAASKNGPPSPNSPDARPCQSIPRVRGVRDGHSLNRTKVPKMRQSVVSPAANGVCARAQEMALIAGAAPEPAARGDEQGA